MLLLIVVRSGGAAPALEKDLEGALVDLWLPYTSLLGRTFTYACTPAHTCRESARLGRGLEALVLALKLTLDFCFY